MNDKDDSALVCAYAAFISQHSWDWWCHLTFPHLRSKDFSMKAVGAWINAINRRRFGSNYWKRGQGVRWVRATERQDRGAYHFHLLIADCEEVDINYAVERWERLSRDTKCLGHSIKIQIYDALYGSKAAEYLAKRVADGDLDFGGPWPQLDLAEISHLNAMR